MDKKWNVRDFMNKESKSREKESVDTNVVQIVTCRNCGSSDFDWRSTNTCRQCGYVHDEPIIVSQERRMFNVEQIKERKTHEQSSWLMYDKNLGSKIGYSKKYTPNQNLFRLLNTERKLTINLEQRELKDVIGILSSLTDSNKLSLFPSEIEHLIIIYRNKFLGKGISVGRLRYGVIAAFCFLELRKIPRFAHLSYNQYKHLIALPPDMEKDFESSVSFLVKTLGYKLMQPDLATSIVNVMMEMGINPIMIEKAKEIVTLISPFYRYRSKKNGDRKSVV